MFSDKKKVVWAIETVAILAVIFNTAGAFSILYQWPYHTHMALPIFASSLPFVSATCLASEYWQVVLGLTPRWETPVAVSTRGGLTGEQLRWLLQWSPLWARAFTLIAITLTITLVALVANSHPWVPPNHISHQDAGRALLLCFFTPFAAISIPILTSVSRMPGPFSQHFRKG